MRERGVTVVATTVNLNGSFSAVAAAWGIVPLYVSAAARLPFFDVYGTGCSGGPGGLFWLDHFCVEDEMAAYEEEMYLSGLGVGFGMLDRGPERKEMYLSALLEKPLKNSRRLSASNP
ncbi:unnamed protein product [Urochloa humidicola]